MSSHQFLCDQIAGSYEELEELLDVRDQLQQRIRVTLFEVQTLLSERDLEFLTAWTTSNQGCMETEKLRKCLQDQYFRSDFDSLNPSDKMRWCLMCNVAFAVSNVWSQLTSVSRQITEKRDLIQKMEQKIAKR